MSGDVTSLGIDTLALEYGGPPHGYVAPTRGDPRHMISVAWYSTWTIVVTATLRSGIAVYRQVGGYWDWPRLYRCARAAVRREVDIDGPLVAGHRRAVRAGVVHA